MKPAARALAAFDVAVEGAEERFATASSGLSGLEREHESMIEREVGLVDELARVYLADLSPKSISRSLGVLRDDLATLLRRQEAHGAGLEARIEDKRKEFVDAFGELQRLDGECEKQEHALEARRKAVEEHLRSEPGYVPMREEHEAAMSKLDRVRARRAELMALARHELPKYGRHREFRYLTRRSFGQPDQKGGAIARTIDSWLARRIDFPRLARNFEILQDGPNALREEIDQLAARAAELEGALDEMEHATAESEGLVPALEALEAVEGQRREAASRKAGARAAYEDDTRELRLLETAQGSHYDEAIALHQEFLKGKEMEELWKIAEATPAPRDDHVVGRLEDHRREIEAKESEIREKVQDLNVLEDRIEELIAIRDEALRQFGHRRSRFRPGMELVRMLDRLAAGEATPKSVLDHIERHHYIESLGASPRSLVEGLMAELSSAFDVDSGLQRDLMSVLSGPDGEKNTYSVTVRDSLGTRSYRRVTRRSSMRGTD